MYINKVFAIIQKITITQSSLLELAGSVSQKQTDRCKMVDFTFFNSPANSSNIYTFLENALEAFAYIQKGFYCTICDASK